MHVHLCPSGFLWQSSHSTELCSTLIKQGLLPLLFSLLSAALKMTMQFSPKIWHCWSVKLLLYSLARIQHIHYSCLLLLWCKGESITRWQQVYTKKYMFDFSPSHHELGGGLFNWFCPCQFFGSFPDFPPTFLLRFFLNMSQLGETEIISWNKYSETPRVYAKDRKQPQWSRSWFQTQLAHFSDVRLCSRFIFNPNTLGSGKQEGVSLIQTVFKLVNSL